MKKSIIKGLKIFLLVISVLMCIAVIVLTVYAVKGYNMYRQAVDKVPVSQMVDSIRQMDNFIEFDQLPEFYVDAVITVEDHRFYSHNGVDLIAISRALWKDITTLSLAEGGSTITQQLSKNLYFTQEKKLERKFAEVFTAFDFEKQYSKNEILELYVNTIYFGSGYYGIYDAAEGYFSKHPSELTEAQCALLAGLPNAPSAYSPDTNPELAMQRMKQVLDRMVKNKVIDDEKAASLLMQQPV